MLFATNGKKVALAAGVMSALAFLILGVAACTSGPTGSTVAVSSTTAGSGSSQTPISTTTTVGAAEAQSPLLHTVTVSGTGHMSALPDQAVINIGVQGSAASAAAALDANSRQMQSVLARLKADGIPDSAVETTNVSVYGYPLFDQKTGKQTGTSYKASNSAKVTLTDFSVIGSVFAAATEAGANDLSGPTWQLSDNTKAQTQALSQASAQARAKAQAFAAANEVALGNVLVLTEGCSTPVYYYGRESAFSATTTAGAGIASPPITPQNLDIYINVTITYQLKQ
ncbi:MAG: SIMPL domain-containing protein [Actinobacteria bacterium]|nr:SIMPL domain-containing protein [Actinomycetota bacterium]